MTKYAELCYNQMTHSLAASNSDNLRHMQSLYNYSRSQKQAQEMTDKAHRQALTIYAAIVLTTALLLIVVLLWQYYHRKRRALQAQYNHEQANLQKALNELRRVAKIDV